MNQNKKALFLGHNAKKRAGVSGQLEDCPLRDDFALLVALSQVRVSNHYGLICGEIEVHDSFVPDVCARDFDVGSQGEEPRHTA